MAIQQHLPLLVVQNLLARAETQMLRPSLLDIPKERWPLIARKDYVNTGNKLVIYDHQQP